MKSPARISGPKLSDLFGLFPGSPLQPEVEYVPADEVPPPTTSYSFTKGT